MDTRTSISPLFRPKIKDILDMITFGPIPSRRLGRSLGINNIPPKVCTYSCVYCQIGRTSQSQINRQHFYNPEEISKETESKINGLRDTEENVDYITFVSDGEPTLDIHLGQEIRLLKHLGIRIAVVTNSSLIDRPDVQEDLLNADWVSLKIDSTREGVWRKINRPYRSLQLSSILDGMSEFSKMYRGTLVTETMLVRSINDGEDNIREVAEFLNHLRPTNSYLSIPTRPPAEEWVQPPSEEITNRCYQILKKRINHVEYLIGYEGNDFAFTGNIKEDLLSITAVHPLREEAVKKLLRKAKADWSIVKELTNQGRLKETEYEGKKFYMRKIHE